MPRPPLEDNDYGTNGDPWSKWAKLVLSELRRLDAEVKDLRRMAWGLMVGLVLALIGVVANMMIALSQRPH